MYANMTVNGAEVLHLFSADVDWINSVEAQRSLEKGGLMIPTHQALI